MFANSVGLNRVHACIRNYISENTSDDISTVMFWDALKATMRGDIIGVMAHAHKALREQMTSIEKENKRIEKQHINSANKDLLDYSKN